MFTSKNKQIEALESEVKLLNEKLESANESDIKSVRKIEEIVSSNCINTLQNRTRFEISLAEKEQQLEKARIEVVVFKEQEKLKFDTRVSAEVARIEKELDKEYLSDINSLEKTNKSLLEDKLSTLGKYEGSLLVIKSLEGQVANLNNIIESITAKLPDVSANIKTAGEQSVIVK